MRYLLMLLMTILPAAADKIIVQTMGCPSVSTFALVDENARSDIIKMQHFANTHGCVILSPSDKIQVLNPNAANPFATIVVQRTQARYRVPRKNVQVEQPGQKNHFSF